MTSPLRPRQRPRRRRALPALGLTAALLSVAAPAASGAPALPAASGAPAAQAVAAPSAGPRAARDVIANLWSWNWRSVTEECTTVLGPAGYGAVWVAPPAESFAHPDGNWWDVYQPYSYELNGRFGTRSEFAAMTKACDRAGVKVYTDAVINHTAAMTGTGYDGTRLTDKYTGAGYGRADYNVDVCDGGIGDWNDKWQVQNCELLGLPDLKTGSPRVRTRIAAYLNSQVALGVAGFRIDAAKHIPAADLEAITGLLRPARDGSRPFVFHEVFPGGTPAPDEYYRSGDVLDFAYADRMKAAFQGDIGQLRDFGPGLLPAERSVSFVTNHDTERDGRHLTYRDGDTAVLANVFQLAWKHSAPTVYAGFEFTGRDDAPPADAAGFVTDTDCGDGWYCLDRDPRITGMVAWHNAVGRADVNRLQTPRSNVLAFTRGRGFVAINNNTTPVTAEFATGLRGGTYCNLLDGCATTVTVPAGKATFTLPAKSAVALHPGVR